jgi:serine protease Do
MKEIKGGHGGNFMRKFPYTDSTELIIYEPKVKKKRNFDFLPCIISAFLASAMTLGAVGLGGHFYKLPQEAQTVATNTNNDSEGIKLLATTGDELTVNQIAKKIGPSCVGIINKAKLQPQRYYDPFSGRYFYYNNPAEGELIEQGSGSGIIISTDGYIVTNQHVIADANTITVILNSGEEFEATLIGADARTDLAVLKINKTGLAAAPLGDSNLAEVGDLAVAIGNPLGQELAGTVTSGVISAVNRKMTVDGRTYNLIQTDAAINPGNSGGALVNKYGQVIGINSIKMSQEGVEGIGFAIAMSEAKPIIDDLMNNGYVSGRPLIGITATESRNGLTVYTVAEDSGAKKAGVKVGDLIIKADGIVVKTVDELNDIKDKKSPGDKVTLTIIRDGELLEIKVELQEDKPNQ